MPKLSVSPALFVNLAGGRDYSLYIGSQILSQMGEVVAGVARSRNAVIITQPKIADLWGKVVQESLQEAGFNAPSLITFSAGERFKTLRTVTNLCDKLYNLPVKLDRKTLLIALGGGVVGDVAGFVAAIYLRGLDYVQVPTTLLAMVDSSVGGKTGVDFHAGKNLIGAFHQPRAVVIDTNTLKTLPRREIRAGMAEIIKYGVIRDPSLLPMVQHLGKAQEGTSEQESHLATLIQRSCEIKAEVVMQDEYETTGLRAILNFGHTVGHALEAVTNYKRFKHGEAVGIGMIAASHIGEKAGITPTNVRETILETLMVCNLPYTIPKEISIEDILQLLTLDKKAEAGKARFVLARCLGEVSLYDGISEAIVREGVQAIYDK